MIEEKKSLGISPKRVWLLRCALVLYFPLVFAFCEISYYFFKNVDFSRDFLFVILPPVVCLSTCRTAVRKVICPKCFKSFYHKNPFKAAFGKNGVCVNCKERA